MTAVKSCDYLAEVQHSLQAMLQTIHSNLFHYIFFLFHRVS